MINDDDEAARFRCFANASEQERPKTNSIVSLSLSLSYSLSCRSLVVLAPSMVQDGSPNDTPMFPRAPMKNERQRARAYFRKPKREHREILFRTQAKTRLRFGRLWLGNFGGRRLRFGRPRIRCTNWGASFSGQCQCYLSVSVQKVKRGNWNCIRIRIRPLELALLWLSSSLSLLLLLFFVAFEPIARAV